MAQSPTNRITRDQLSAFLTDFRTIRQFEELFATQQADLPAALILAEEAQIAAGDANAAAQQAIDAIGSLRDTVEFVALAPPTEPRPKVRRGAFLNTATQTAAVIDTAYAITYDTTTVTEGVALSSPASRVQVDTAGVYSITASVQLDKTGAGADSAWLWVRVNGTDIAASARRIRVNGTDDEKTATLTYQLQLAPGDYFELMWAAGATDIQLQAVASAAFRPAVSSVLLNVIFQP